MTVSGDIHVPVYALLRTYCTKWGGSAGPTQRRYAQGEEENHPPPHVISNIDLYGSFAKKLILRYPCFWNMKPRRW